MKKFYSFCIMLALVLGMVSFVGCEKEKNNTPPTPEAASLQAGNWVCDLGAGYMYFEFQGSNFKFHEVGYVMGEPVDAWAGGTYVIVGNDLTLSYTDCNAEDMRSSLDKMEKHAVLDNDKIYYQGYTFILQK